MEGPVSGAGAIMIAASTVQMTKATKGHTRTVVASQQFRNAHNSFNRDGCMMPQ